MKKKALTIIYAVATISGGMLLSALAQTITPIIPMILGLFVLPVLMLTALRQYTLPAATFLWLGMSFITVLAAPSVAWGVLLAVVWYAGAMILRVSSDWTLDLFPILLYGGSLYLLLILLSAALIVKDIYGVYDFKSVFAEAEEFFRTALENAGNLYASVLPKQEYQKIYEPLLKTLMNETEAIVYQAISFVLVLLGGWYFCTLKIAQHLCRPLRRHISAAPMILYGVPREIAWCYLLLWGVSLFIGDTYYHAFNIALTLTGFLLVPAGVGVVDGFMQKWHPAVRTLLKALMLFIAFFGNYMSSGIVYTVLMVGGLYISLFRRIEFRRMKGDHKDE